MVAKPATPNALLALDYCHADLNNMAIQDATHSAFVCF